MPAPEALVPTETETISASKFKAKCLSILDRFANHELKRVTITKRGQPVAVLTPPERKADAVRGIYGFMRGMSVIADDVDLRIRSWMSRSHQMIWCCPNDGPVRRSARYVRGDPAGKRRIVAARHRLRHRRGWPCG